MTLTAERPVLVAAATPLVLAAVLPKAFARAVAIGALVLALAAPAAYSVATAAVPHSGALPSPGPAAARGTGFPGGGLLGAPTPGARVVEVLRADADRYRWAAAVVGSNNAAGYQLASGLPVLAVGGFNGTDPAPTLAEFTRLVADGRIHWFIDGSMMRGETGSDAAARITEWVEDNYAATTVDGVTLYDLSGVTR